MKKIIIFGVASMVLVTTALGFLLFRDTGDDEILDKPVNEQVQIASSTTEANTRGNGSLEELMTLNKDLECNIIYRQEFSPDPIEGTYFTHKGMMRGDFILPESGLENVSSLILRDDNLYSWSVIAGEAYGMKISLDTLAENKASTTALATREPVPLSAKVAYDCKKWERVDQSIFELPEAVLFKDYAELTAGGMEDGTTYESKLPCGLCDNLEAESDREACRSDLSCR